MRIVKPDENYMFEIAGRMYETSDLERAISSGMFSSIDDVLKHVQTLSAQLSRVLKKSEWVIDANSCLDVEATIER